MRTKNGFRILAFMLMLILPALVLGQIPQTLSYQGVLSKAKGEVVTDGYYEITFKLYTTDKGGTSIWSETQSIEVKNGLFNAALGSEIALDLPFDKPYWLGLTVGEEAESAQRMELTASAYSLHAQSIADSAVTGKNIAKNQVVRGINSLTDDVNLVAGENVTITQEGKSLVISANIDRRGTGNGGETDVLTKVTAPPNGSPGPPSRPRTGKLKAM